MADTPAPKQRTGVDDARDRGRAALERLRAIKPGESLGTWQEAAVVALGSLSKPEEPRAEFDFVLAQAITNSLDGHTEKMATLANRLNWFTGALVVATVLLVGATLLLVRATLVLAAAPK